jgi:hypothetical protein
MDYRTNYEPLTSNVTEHSDWTCYLFGSKGNNGSIAWTPAKGDEPNWFWRKMQYLCFGNLWVKKGGA